ncbi:acetyltransferase (GNAT) family protein [Krasilnikovia cinnamomea]|uniref:Acetyltransferase (GNAT) family protein n=1 Tax=Krasilnikovia cinnamomea TaxID=349313 RepID=A0A4Q7ZNS5_9ACTN|nr:GNAT family N-acetyltransferase [Krasilnikovia cinnamomea]RZU52143.1 acetyltransferase (GNAT) family protein [Krasilnikovia cinnamomea]
MAFISDALSEHHVTEHFDSGKPDLDSWLKQHALTTEARRTGRTFVWHDDERVVAYYTIAAHLIVREELPRVLGRGNPGQIPAVLLARLALDKALHGQGLGGALLADALQRIVVATRTVAARFVVVDAIDEAAHGFYLHHGFREIPGTMRLIQKVSDIAAAVAP